MRIIGKKRLLLSVGGITAVGAAATLVAGVTFGLFSSQIQSGTNTFTAGTIVVNNTGQPADTTCTPTTVLPGDSGACTFHVRFDGTTNPAHAALALDVLVSNTQTGTSQPAYSTGTTPPAEAGLWDPLTSGLTAGITDGTNNYTSTYSYKDQTGASQTIAAGTAVTDLLVSADVSATTTYTFTVNWTMPSAAGNGFQNAKSTIKLTFHAVQIGNNAVPSGAAPTGCTVGWQCSDQGSFKWES